VKLGGSLRRSRGSGGSRKKRAPAAGKRKSPRAKASPGLGRLLLGLAALGGVGWGTGYLFATQVVFPAPPPPADMVEVPDLRGLGPSTAGERLAGAGLVLGTVDSLKHPTMASDLILGQSPLPGQLALPGSTVDVTRSAGAQRRAVPDVRRVDASRARILLQTAGFVVNVDSVDSEVPRGRVVSTSPREEAMVSLPAEIRLAVSRGPPLVTMPLLLGMEEAEATAQLESLGLVLGEVEEVFRFGRDQGIVVEQEPAAETPLERGSAVRLAVGRRGG
jgi:serine/threonine-protein kinase